jgi:hypothetical protein
MLRVAQVPTLVAMHRERVTETLVGAAADAPLAAFLKRAIATGRAAGAAVPPPGDAAVVDVDKLLSDGFAALRTLGGADADADAASVRAAASAFSAVLAPDAAASPVARARALAGLARAALAGASPDLDTAKELAAAARAAAADGVPPPAAGMPSPPPPPEVAAAEAYIALLERCAHTHGFACARRSSLTRAIRLPAAWRLTARLQPPLPLPPAPRRLRRLTPLQRRRTRAPCSASCRATRTARWMMRCCW